MTSQSELYKRVRYISVLIDALLKAHPEWTVERRHMVTGVQYIIFTFGEKHSSVTIDPVHDDLRSIHRRFHFLEADFLFFISRENGISLTNLPQGDKIDLTGPEPTPGPTPDYRAGLKAGVQIVLVAELLILTIVSWAYITIQLYPG